MTQAEATLFVYDDLIRIFLLASVLTMLTMPVVFVICIRAGKNTSQTVSILITNTMTNYPVFLLISIIWLTLRRF